MFIKANESLINLDNVTNIGFLDNKLKIVFNFNCSIDSDKKGRIQLVADYRYWSFDNVDDYNNAISDLEKLIINDKNWIIHKNHHWVNLKYVTHINSDKAKNRIIFNLNNSITRDTRLGEDSLINDFVFWTFENSEDFNNVFNSVVDTVIRRG